jgi:non-specific serine/threonine protein kinase/serine/threonine-protein kinase
MARLEPTLREAVEQLLTADLEPGGLLERGPVHLASQAATALTGGFKNVGTYRILRLTGRGGMGTVYEAQQESPKRIVALKVIRADLGGLESVGRFVREVEILGRLQHPGIANIYDAGIADGGAGPQRYLAMEFVQGKDLVEAGGGLPVRARIGLFMKVCDAVQHAHSRGVIHRDLKPSNILVNGEGEPKILDFGVARMIEPDVDATFRTEAGQLIGTLAYMSPEQAQGAPNGIDVRTDVYSLGVVLYELLAGKLPYPTKGVAVLEAVRVVQEEDAAPSTGAFAEIWRPFPPRRLRKTERSGMPPPANCGKTFGVIWQANRLPNAAHAWDIG